MVSIIAGTRANCKCSNQAGWEDNYGKIALETVTLTKAILIMYDVYINILESR